MTLQEALAGYDWIPDPNVENRARIAGPDSSAAVVVEEMKDSQRLKCWLWCWKTGERLGETILIADTPDDLEAVLDELYRIRTQTGDCPTCGMPLGTENDVVRCACGYHLN